MSERTSLKTQLMASICLLAIGGAVRAKTIYVDDDAGGANDGSSWVDAYSYLQDALGDANSSEKPVEILVAQGVYTPDSNSADPNGTGDREATFQLINGVAREGGYAGFVEPDPNERDANAYNTILSGDLDGDDEYGYWGIRGTNSCSIVTGSGTDGNAVLDGFAITRGSPRDSCRNGYRGGGMYNLHGSPTVRNCVLSWSRPGMWNEGGAPTLTNCIFGGNSTGMHNVQSSPILLNCGFYENWGGGMENWDNSHPILTMCEFSENQNGLGGGGLLNEHSSATLIACMFYYNNTDSGDGAGVCNYSSNVELTDCTFVGNSAFWYGGGMASYDSNLVLTDCTFRDNAADDEGGGMTNGKSSLILTNCTFSGNSATGLGGAGMANRYCNVELTNCSFSGNVVSERWGIAGGGILNIDGGDIKLTNCTFAANWAPNGKAVACYSSEMENPSNVEISNCILWDGGDEIWNENESAVTITYSNIQGGWPADSGETANIAADPCFVEDGYWKWPPDFNDYWWHEKTSWVDGDNHLKSQAGRWDSNSQSWFIDDVTSLCIDGGDPITPIGHEPFANGGIINMGAYGGTVEASKSYFGKTLCESIVAGDLNGDCEVDFLDLRLMGLHWMKDYDQ